jgi:hypothetical protein
MRCAAGLWGLAVLAGGLAAGCRGPGLVAPPSCPTAEPCPPELPAVAPGRIEPDLAALPKLEPDTLDPGQLFATDPGSFRGLTERHCRQLAASRSAIANLLDAENERPAAACPPAALREARVYAAQDARNRAAADALDRFFQLADAEARADLLAHGLQAFDQLRKEAAKLRAAGLPAPADDELSRQRAKLLADAEQAEAGIKLLNIDLKARLGLSTKGAERLWPVGDFGIRPDPVDAEAAVRFALETRPDLRLVRALYLGLSSETLPAVRDQLRGAHGLLGMADPPALRLLRLALLTGQPDPQDLAEIDARRRQLFDLVAERERLAAAEVRAAVVALDSAARRVALARSRVEGWQAKTDELREKGGRPAEVLQAETEWYKTRGELVVEVMGWHRARVKLGLAVGRFE